MVDTLYRAFVSYTHLDREWGEWLHRSLEAYRVPRKLVGTLTREGSTPRRLTPIFRDRDDLPTSGSLSASVETALERSRFLIVICSPAAAQSEWVGEEIRLFKKLHGEDRILAMIVGGAPNASDIPGREAEECFPATLRFKLDANGALTAERAEPLGTDIREEGDGKKYGFTKIVAGLIGVGLDDLIQRESRRRGAKLKTLAAATSAAALAMGGLAWFAIDSRNEAQLQRNEAEGLVEFMLTDLKAKLDAVGRLDALDSVGERALAYYAAQDKDQLDADSLGRRARAQLLVGEIDNLRGDLDAALNAYMEAAATTAEQLQRHPNNAQRIFDHAQSVFWVGYIAWQRGDTKKAEAQFQEYLTLAERLVAIDANNATWQTELGYAYSNLGTLAIEGRRYDNALEYFQKSRTVAATRLAAEPNDMQRMLELGQADSWIARTLKESGDFDEALKHYRAELETYDRVFQIDPRNQLALLAALVAHRSIASVLLYQGQAQPARTQLLSALKNMDAAIALDPDHTQWLEQACKIHLDLSAVERLLGDNASAYKRAERAAVFAKNLRARNSEMPLWRSLEVSAEVASLATQRSLVDPLSIAALRTALNSVSAPDSQNGPDAELSSAPLTAGLMLGDALAAGGDDGAARRAWQQALSFMNGLPETVPVESAINVATLLFRVGRTEDAQRLVDRLVALDVQHPDFLKLKAAMASGAVAQRN